MLLLVLSSRIQATTLLLWVRVRQTLPALPQSSEQNIAKHQRWINMDAISPLKRRTANLIRPPAASARCAPGILFWGAGRRIIRYLLVSRAWAKPRLSRD